MWQGVQWWLSLDGKVRQRLFPQQWARKQGVDQNQGLTSDLKRFTSRDLPPKDFVLLKTAGPEHESTGKTPQRQTPNITFLPTPQASNPSPGFRHEPSGYFSVLFL